MKRLASNLKLEPELWERFFRKASGLMCVADKSGFFVKVNETMISTLGYTEEELLSRPLVEFVHPDDVTLTIKELESLTVGKETVEFDNRYRCADGRILNLRWFASFDSEAELAFATARDVTEQLRQERELRAFRETLDQTHDGILFCEAETLRYTYANRGAVSYLGFSGEELLAMTPLDINPYFDERELREALAPLKSGRSSTISFETMHQHKTGYLIPVLVTYQIVHRTDMSILVALVKDITQQKRDEAFRRSILNTVDDTIVSIDGEGTVQTCNRAVERVLGYRADEVVGQNVGMLFAKSESCLVDDIVDLKVTSKRVDGLHKNTELIPLHLKIAPMSIGGSSFNRYFLIVLRDLTEQMRAEATLEGQNKKLAAVARTDRMLAQLMVSLNEENEDVAAAGAALLRVLSDQTNLRPLALYLFDEMTQKLDLQSSLGLSPNFQESFHIGEGLVGEAAERRATVKLKSKAKRPLLLHTGLGTIELANIFAFPLICRDQLLGVLMGASLTELTKRGEDSLNQVASQFAISLQATRQRQELSVLSTKLSERTRETVKTNRELKRANQLKSEFLASMSHELRTPLNAIIGFSEILKDGILGELSDRQLDYVGEIFQSGQHLLSLINDILDLSKIEAGKMDLETETVCIEALAKNAITLVRGLAATKGVELELTVEPGMESLEADSRKLRQIIYNLLSNAIKFTDSGGRVSLEVYSVEDTIEIAVRDTGIGISVEDQKRLFQPFIQLDGGMERKYEGTGLGLVMVERLVNLHGGVLGLESTPGEGSRFWVRIPAKAVPVLDLRNSSTDTDTTVLVVDDDPSAVILATEWLERGGAYVYSASGYESAWAVLQRETPDLILLDILFRGGPDGWALLEKLKKEESTANIPVVVVSVSADLERGMALGAFDVLQKPVSGSELLKVMDAVKSRAVLTPKQEAQTRAFAREDFLGTVKQELSSITRRVPYVLLAEKDPHTVERLKSYLSDEPMELMTVTSGREALKRIEARKPDLLILDLALSDIGGLEVIETLKRQERKDIPVLILTANSLTPSEEQSLLSNSQAIFLRAKSSPTELLRTMRELLKEPS